MNIFTSYIRHSYEHFYLIIGHFSKRTPQLIQLPNMAPSFVKTTAFQREHSEEFDNVISKYI
jgi:hypothetical protein